MNSKDIDDIIYLESNDVYVKYSNVLKNSYNTNPWKTFMVKSFDEDGIFNREYIECDVFIFREKNILPYTLVFNPEKLV